MSQPQSNQSTWSSLLPRLARYLPASTFNRLLALPHNLDQLDDDSQHAIAAELLSAVRALDPLHRVLLNYMPRYLLELSPTPGQPHSEILEGTFIFADVTGFTTLTELLSRQAQGRGFEAMNQIMNRLFSAVLDPLIASGGDLLYFVGDAVLIYFPKRDQQADVLQATRAALRMERAIQPFASFETEFGQCSLTMSAGVERGVAYAAVVGDQRRMELLVSGPGIYAATLAEQQTEPGQVALGEQAHALLAAHFTLDGPIVIDDLGTALGDYEIDLPSTRRSGSVLFGRTIPDALEALTITLGRVERLAPFLPEDMLARLVNTDRQRQLQPELRPVAVQFVNLVGLEELALSRGSELATHIFQRFFVRAQEIIHQHEGVISQIDAYSQGFILVNTFGTPRAHEGTHRYAVSAALQLGQALDQINHEFALEPPLQQRSGITQGLIFTGEIGALYRRESVIAGPAVNRAARLMSKAQPGQVILDSEIWDSASSAFVGESLPPVNLKGIEGPVVIVNVRQIRRGTRLLPPDRPLLGRETEQARLHQALTELAATATGRAWLISGETGLGKTSLVADLAEQARQQELTVLIGRCQPHGKTVPLFAWLDLLTGWLDFNEQTSPSLQRVRLAEELASLELGALDKILANLLALPALDTLKEVNLGTADSAPATSGSLLSLINHKLQAPSPPPPLAQPSLLNMLQQRLTQPQPASQSLWTRLEERVNSPQAILKLLTKLAQRQPLLLILEDIYWLDPDSAAVLHELFRQLPNLPIMLLLTSHEPEALPHLVIDLPLAKLTTPILEQIGARALGASALDPSLAEWICRHADGNPLYVHELGQALEQTESIRVDKDTGLVHWTGQAPPLPLSLRALLLARLDELSLTQQAVLKRAAVIGSTFSLAELLELSRPQLGEAELQEVLVGAIATSFLVPLQETRYGFNHPLMQETIYATLTFSQRQKWHTQMGDWLAAHQAEPEQYLELMAFHYLRGHNSDKATQYGLQAGDKARQRGAYSGAGDYYSQVLALPHLPAAVQLSAYEAQADLLALQGNYLAALTAYSQAVQLGSRTAQEKQLILAGEVEQLAQATFSAEFQPWARGGQAWLLARQHQSELALRQLQLALPQADQVALPILEALAHLLETGEEIGPYDQWLKRFTQTKLGLST